LTYAINTASVKTIEEIEKKFISETLKLSHHNKSKVQNNPVLV
jgi:hypothetical protein